MSWAIGLRLATREKFVLLMLSNYASNERGDCYPSLGRLCDDTGMSRHTVIEGIKTLEAMGALAVVRRHQDGVNLPNVYRLHLAWGGSAPDAPVVRHLPGGSAPDALKPITEPINKKKESARVEFDGERLSVPDAIKAQLTVAYPAASLDAEIERASVWCRLNPTRRPKSDFGRFLNGWLNRAGQATRPAASKHDRREAFMEGLFGPERLTHVIDVAAHTVG